MGIDAMRISVEVRRFLVFSIKICYRSVCNHPFLVGIACFLLFLHRSFPFLFSLLVSASPVLVCTAVLLGTLLSFGEPNIPEIEKGKEKQEDEEEVTHEISSLRAGIVGDATVVVERDKSFSLESFARKRGDSAEKIISDDIVVDSKYGEIERDDGLSDYMPLIDKGSHELHFENKTIQKMDGEYSDMKLEKDRESLEKKHGIKEMLRHVENEYSLGQSGVEENLEEEGKSPGDLIGTQMDDHLDFSQNSSWKRVNENDEEEDEEDEDASDSGSDRAESSSPDASMADIIPMLDELHPLLDVETPQPAHMSHDGSDAGSERSHKSREASVESEEENNIDEELDGDDENDNEEEETHGGKEDESRSAITWTEDDQKNLMDLGTLELERNQRLESLIARRRARRNMRFMPEKNLIDLDGVDLPFNVPAISTTRCNPFDLPYDDVPGSAPSILLPRRNPFDLPYDSSEEKPDLKGDNFQQEFSAIQHREPIFRRHESFSTGPSVLGGAKHGRQELRWKPYFVPEQYGSEEASYHTFQRQLSEVSDSKVSSVPDTESVGSAVEEDKKLTEEDVSQETEMISSVDHASVLVERGSVSSEDVDSLDTEQIERGGICHGEAEIAYGNVENHHEIDLNLSTSEAATPGELNTSEILLQMEGGEEEYSSRSSLSSLSEIDEKISDAQKELTSLEARSSQLEESHISTQTSLDSDFHFMTGLEDDNQHREPVSEPSDDHTMDSSILKQSSLESDLNSSSGVVDNSHHNEPAFLPKDNHIVELGISSQLSATSDFHIATDQHKEPVYDSSPPSIDKFHSFSSVSSDRQGEILEMDSPPPLVEIDDKDSEVYAESMEKDDLEHKDVHESSSPVYVLEENESRSREGTEIGEHESIKVGQSEVCPNFDGENGFKDSEQVVDRVSIGRPPSSLENESVEGVVPCKEESSHHEQDQLDSSSIEKEITVQTHEHVIGKLNSASSSSRMASEEISLPPVAFEHVTADSSLSLSESTSEHVLSMEVILQLEQDQVRSPSFDAQIHADGRKPVVEELALVASNSEHDLSNNLHVYAHREVVVSGRDSEACTGMYSSETEHEGEHSIIKENTLQLEQEQVHSSSFDATIDACHHRDVDMNVALLGSTYGQVSTEEKSLLESEKQASWSDKSIVEPSFNSGELKEASSTLADSTEEVSISNNVNVLEFYNHGNLMAGNISSSSVPPQSFEYQSRVGEVDSKDSILDRIVYEDNGHVLEQTYHSPAEKSPVAEQNINEEGDEIKEIDEGLLSELDTVGDFSVKEIVGELLHDEQLPEQAIVGSPEFNLLQKDSSLTEIKPELPVLDVRSVEDIDLAFKQIHEGVDVEEVILPSMIKDQLIVNESHGNGETSSGLQVVEATSLEDIDTAVKQISEGNGEGLSRLSDLKDVPSEVNKLGFTVELPALEVGTIEDIEFAFKQLHEGVDVEEVILPSMIERQLVVDESKDIGQASLNLQEVEAKNVEDIHIAMKQLAEGNIEKLPKPSDLKDRPEEGHEEGPSKEMESRTLEAHAAGSANGIESSAVEITAAASTKDSGSGTVDPTVQGSITIAPHVPNNGFDETS